MGALNSYRTTSEADLGAAARYLEPRGPSRTTQQFISMACERAEVRDDEARVCPKPNPSSVGSGSPLPPPPSTRNGGGDLHWGSDRMVEIELHAARALADLAQTDRHESRCRGRESGGGERDDTGRKSRKRVRSGSSSRARERSYQGSENSRSKHACLVDEQHEDKKASEGMMGQGVNVLGNSGLRSSGIHCDTSHDVSFRAQRIKGNLSEAEKESKRIRRVLANRESARQTIRRREALREEMAKRVADLSLDNENMKMEKELVIKEYLSLKENNKQLKEQIDKTIRCDAKRAAEITIRCDAKRAAEIASTEVESEWSTSSSTKLPLFACNGPPLAPLIWPALQPCFDEGNPCISSGLRPPFFVPPYAWFYPLMTDQSSGYRPPYPHVRNDQDEAALDRPQGLNFRSEAMDDVDKSSFCSGSKTDVSLSTTVAAEKERDAIGTNWNYHAKNQVPGCYADVVASPSRSLNPCSIVKSEPCTEARDEPVRDQLDTMMREKPWGGRMYPREKLVDAKVAAEARRRRRKEVKKLKHLHGRHVRLHH